MPKQKPGSKARKKPPKVDPLKRDPSRTAGLRQQMTGEINTRFGKLKAAIREFIVVEDQLGLKPLASDIPFGKQVDLSVAGQLPTVNKYRFATDDQKMEGFKSWFKQQVDAGILETDNPTEPWTSTYVKSAYKSAAIRSYTEVHKETLGKAAGFYEGSKAQFLLDAFDSPEAVSKIKLITTRAFDQLKGVTADMDKRISMVLGNAMAGGWGAAKTAKALNDEVVELGQTRAKVIARTELVHAHAEGQLDSFELLGVEDVGLNAEWKTAGDDRVCPRCQAKAGTIYKIKDARRLIPLHPNCRCAWVPHMDLFPGATQPQGPKKPKTPLKEATVTTKQKTPKAEPKKPKAPKITSEERAARRLEIEKKKAERAEQRKKKAEEWVARQSEKTDKARAKKLKQEIDELDKFQRGAEENLDDLIKDKVALKEYERKVLLKEDKRREASKLSVRLEEASLAKPTKRLEPKVVEIPEGPTFYHHGDTSAAFEKKVRKVVEKLPRKVRFKLKSAGKKMATARKSVVEALPSLKDAGQPRGWNPGDTFENVGGVYSQNEEVAIVSEYAKSVFDGKWVARENVEGVMRHEVGHALDDAFTRVRKDDTGRMVAERLCDQEEYVKVYDKALGLLAAYTGVEYTEAAERLSYTLQPGSAGRSESMAEGFAQVMGGGCYPPGSRTQELFMKVFAPCIRFLKDKIEYQ